MSNLFINAERRMYDYLESKVQGIGGSAGQWPRKTGEVDAEHPQDLNEWRVSITGDGDNLNTMLAAGTSPSAVGVSVMVEGRFASRRTALWFAGVLVENLPETIENIAHFGPVDNALPVIEEAVLTVGEAGYEVNGWTVSLDCMAVIGRVDELDLE